MLIPAQRCVDITDTKERIQQVTRLGLGVIRIVPHRAVATGIGVCVLPRAFTTANAHRAWIRGYMIMRLFVSGNHVTLDASGSITRGMTLVMS